METAVQNRKKAPTVRTLEILHLRSSFDPGGTETLLLNLFNYPQDDFRIHLALLKDGTLIDRLNKKAGNQAYRWYRKRFFDLEVFNKLRGLVREKEIRIIHTHQFIELVYALGLKLLYPQVKIVHHIHVMFQKKNPAFFLERYLAQRFARVVTVSRASKEELAWSFGFKKENISILYNGIQFAAPEPVDRITVDEKLKMPIKPDRVNIVMVANFVWGKDHETLFKAFDSYIREQLPQVSFYFIGRESAISENLKQKYLREEDISSGRMVFTGPIPNARTLLPVFDMAVMSCFSETFNMALVEAAAMGKVILASDIPVFRELSENGRYFHHFKTGDAQDLFESLDYLVKNLPEVSGKNHAVYYQHKFGFDVFVSSLNEIYISEKE